MVNEEKAILQYLIEHKEQKFSINQLAKARNINYKSAYQNILKLRQRGVIKTEKLASATLCSFNYILDPLVFAVETKRREIILRNKNFRSIYRELKKLDNPFFIVLVFGSQIKGNKTKQSDIDLLLIADDKKLSENIDKELSLLPFKIHAIHIPTVDFLKMAHDRDFSVVEEAKKNNIILMGIENYYHLLQNVRL